MVASEASDSSMVAGDGYFAAGTYLILNLPTNP